MALSNIATSVRNAQADAAVDLIDGGSTDAAGDLQILTSIGGSVLATFTLQNPAFGSAASGVATMSGLPLSTTATGTGTAAAYAVRDRDNNVLWNGTVTATGGGGDIEISSTSINTSDTVNLTAFTHTAPAS